MKTGHLQVLITSHFGNNLQHRQVVGTERKGSRSKEKCIVVVEIMAEEPELELDYSEQTCSYFLKQDYSRECSREHPGWAPSRALSVCNKMSLSYEFVIAMVLVPCLLSMHCSSTDWVNHGQLQP